MRGKLLLTLVGGARKIIDPNQLVTYGEHSLDLTDKRGQPRVIKLCRVGIRERNAGGEESLNEYDLMMSAAELRARLREAFLELGDTESARTFE